MRIGKLTSIYRYVRGRCNSQPGPSTQRDVLVYSRAGCHLCDEALQILAAHGLYPEVVDIDTDPGLVAEYGCCVPVVTIDGKVRFRGRVNAVLLKRLLLRR